MLCAALPHLRVPVVDERGVLLGIVTNRDMRFVPDHRGSRLGPRGHDPDAAGDRPGRDRLRRTPLALLAKHKIEKLPLVDDAGRLHRA